MGAALAPTDAALSVEVINDERIPVRAMYDDVVYWQTLIRALAS